MLRIRLAVIVLTAALVAAALAAPASAGSRSSAQRFADAALRAKLAIRQGVPQAREVWLEHVRPCKGLLEASPPRHARRHVRLLEESIAFAPGEALRDAAMTTFMADLEAIPTDDPALRSGRSAWRELLRAHAAIPLVDRPCEVLAAWEATGYARAAAPKLPLAAYDAAMDRSDRVDEVAQLKLERAGLRMHRLGVSEGDALRFMGHRLYEDLADVFPEEDR